jgi:hypothetical protein
VIVFRETEQKGSFMAIFYPQPGSPLTGNDPDAIYAELSSMEREQWKACDCPLKEYVEREILCLALEQGKSRYWIQIAGSTILHHGQISEFQNKYPPMPPWRRLRSSRPLHRQRQ